MSHQYNQLTREERYHIWQMKRMDKSSRAIGWQMNRSYTTILREINRNTGGSGYRYLQANDLARRRHKSESKAIKLTAEIKRYASEKLMLGWSPEIICGRLLKEQQIRLHHETLYRWLYRDKAQGGVLYRQS